MPRRDYLTDEYETENYIAIVRKPILTNEERKAREEDVKAALVQFGRERRSELHGLS